MKHLDAFATLTRLINTECALLKVKITLVCERRNHEYFVDLVVNERVIFSEKTAVSGDDTFIRETLCHVMIGRIFRYGLLAAYDDINNK